MSRRELASQVRAMSFSCEAARAQDRKLRAEFGLVKTFPISRSCVENVIAVRDHSVHPAIMELCD